MKYYLTILLFAFSMSAKAQWYGTAEDTIKVGSYDTVAVHLLVSDTCIKNSDVVFSQGISGYRVSVRKPFVNEPGSHCTNCPNYWEFVCFLDSKKRKLSSCIIAWIWFSK